ncbi:MAG: hypothetical protein GIW98_04815 [Candidatus Eremiobacteraeota bacterium]|nr:hypothetical protein [Candidatus Eremiobacteraeota bacterium]
MTPLSKLFAVAVLVCGLTLSFAYSGRTQTFLSGAPIDGVRCDRAEGTKLHIHQHLLLYNRGSQVTVPSLIGIPPAADCFYWIHTHNDDGIIHVESPMVKTFTLGQFFDIWGEPLNSAAAATVRARAGRTLKVWVNSRAFPERNLRSLSLRNKTDIVIMSGPPFKRLPPLTNWKALSM